MSKRLPEGINQSMIDEYHGHDERYDEGYEQGYEDGHKEAIQAVINLINDVDTIKTSPIDRILTALKDRVTEL